MSSYFKRDDVIEAMMSPSITNNAVILCNIGAAIFKIPAADVRENIHAHWEMLSYDEAVCTSCGYNRNTPFCSTREARERWSELPPFCEMCGAVMNEEGET